MRRPCLEPRFVNEADAAAFKRFEETTLDEPKLEDVNSEEPIPE